MLPINLTQKFTQFTDHWSPHIIGELNGQYVKIAKVQGEFIWHQHEHEDELFYVVKGELHIDFRDKSVTLNPGEMLIVPRGVEHKPWAAEETHIMLFEPKATLNTGEHEESELTKKKLGKL